MKPVTAGRTISATPNCGSAGPRSVATCRWSRKVSRSASRPKLIPSAWYRPYDPLTASAAIRPSVGVSSLRFPGNSTNVLRPDLSSSDESLRSACRGNRQRVTCPSPAQSIAPDQRLRYRPRPVLLAGIVCRRSCVPPAAAEIRNRGFCQQPATAGAIVTSVPSETAVLSPPPK